jgi:NTP pyrophosphatase (non-canonical NTP hydrolase)
MTQDIKSLALQAVQQWGNEPQLSQATEELAELIVAINHYRRGRVGVIKLAEEVADCFLMLEQIKIIADIPEATMQIVQQAKLEKLNTRLNPSEKPS